ncbi:hypothetical protein [Mesorhizobium sp. B2-4-6]|uniref:hypothetical protein n=1 Tax=Mesorhizobium sp. B2-4-6 TaxID=2589943 RepID=UPI00112A2F3F|nr:hypothetical protein [Mesorhizobium sp. B2-4-6]TPL40668.1 hypothetical protein FJ957_25905 [Mesorhizobium sp. B2-4-6]
MDADTREDACLRADHLIRLLSDYGVALIRPTEKEPPAPSTSETIISNQVFGDPKTFREIIAVDGKFEIVTVKAGVGTVEQSFTLNEVMLNAGLVLSGDPAAKSVKGLGTQLAAATEIYRLNAAGLAGGK